MKIRLHSAFARLAAFTLCVSILHAPAQIAPAVTTLPASEILSIGMNTTATLNGAVCPNGLDTVAWFEWGTSTNYGHTTTATNVGDGWTTLPVSNALTGLTSGLRYHFQLVASNSVGVALGTHQVFWSPAILLNSPDILTNECHVPFIDPTTINVWPVAIAGGGDFSLTLRADGTVVGWGLGTTQTGSTHDYGQVIIPASATNVVAIAGGDDHSLALRADGTVIGWGRNNQGQTNSPASATNAVAIAAGGWFSLALRTDGTVVGWGQSPGSFTSSTNVVAIAAGYHHGLALRADGTVVGWGLNNYGQTNTPSSATNVMAIAAGDNHSLALRADGTVVGWGYNGDGQANSPASATNVVAIAAGSWHSLALRADGTVVGWGGNGWGQATGVPNIVYPNSSTGIVTVAGQTLTNVVAIASGRYHSLALKADGTVVGWGNNSDGQTDTPAGFSTLNLPMAVSSAVNVDVPGTYVLTYSATNALGAVGTATRTVVVVGAPQVTTLSASDVLSVGTNASATFNGMVNPAGLPTLAWFEWGTSTSYGHTTTATNVGDGWTTLSLSNVLAGLTSGITYHYRLVASNSVGAVQGADQIFWSPAIVLNSPNPMTNECHVPFVDPTTVNASPLAIAAGYNHSLALKADSTVVGWGYYGTDDIPANATNVVGIAAGAWHNLALRADGTAVGWASEDTYDIPACASNVVAIAAGDGHSLALMADGTVVGWGWNDYGQTNTPAGATNVMGVAAGYGYSLVLTVDRTVVGWGLNDRGQATGVANPTPPYASTGIVTVAGQTLTNVVAIAAGYYHSLALRADGTVVGWGNNSDGQTTIPASATNVVAIAAGGWHSLALRRNGTVVSWGRNNRGQRTIPASATNVVAIAAGYYHSLALRADDTVVGWGDNGEGQTDSPDNLSTLNLGMGASGAVAVDVPGTYVLTYSTTNALGAVATATRTVVVTDTLPPVLALLGDNPLMHELGAPFVDPGATATDLCAGDLSESIFVWGTVNTSVPGSYSLIYIVTDASGNLAVTDRTVLVGGPLAVTLPASNVVNDTATFNGTVNPHGVDTTAWFEWGMSVGCKSSRYDHTTTPVTIGSGTNPVAMTAALSGLTPGIIYHYRLVASNSVWVSRGAEEVFWSPAIVLNSPNPMTNECHVPFVDPTTVNASPLAIAAGYNHSLALKADSTVVGWGSYASYDFPAGASNVVAIAAGRVHSLALQADGTVISSGSQTNIPASVTNVVAIAAGAVHNLALKADGTVVGWGRNTSGEANAPVSATNVVAVAAGGDPFGGHSLALRADGTVVGWGWNNYDQTNSPVSATNVVAIAAGRYHSLALRADGTIVGWGRNNYDQTSSPVSATNVVAIAAGGYHNLALRADGTVIGWGANQYGQATGVPNTLPPYVSTGVVAVAGQTLTNVVAIEAGIGHSLALQADGTVVGWGYNGDAQTTIPASVYQLNLPIAVSGTVEADVPGTYVLTYSTTNALGAVATATRTVIAADTLPPVVTLLGENPLMQELGVPFVDPGATATDLCAGDRTGNIFVWGTVDANVPDSYPLLYIVSDFGGNLAVTNRTVVVVTNPRLTGMERLGDGAFRFMFTNTPGARFNVLASTNVALSLSGWTVLGPVVEGPLGTFQFSDVTATNHPTRFYRLRWP